jgi:hypothetical protein
MRRKKQKKILIYNTVKQAEQNKLYRQCIADQIKYLDENFDKRSKEMAEFAVFVEQVKGYLKDRELDEDFDNFIAEFQIIGYDHKKNDGKV